MFLRNCLISSSLLVSTLATLSFPLVALAETTNDSVGVTGTVNSIIAITATQTTEGQALPMTGGSQVVHIADVDITSNNTAGITITASSTNTGVLVSGNNTADNINYTVAIVNDAVTAPSSGTAIGSLSQSETTGFDTTTGVKPVDLYILYNVPTLPKKGNYSDTITLTVTDN